MAELLAEEKAYNALIDELHKCLQGVMEAHEPRDQIAFIKPLIHEHTDAAGVRWDVGGPRNYCTVSSDKTVPLWAGSINPLFAKITNQAGDI